MSITHTFVSGIADGADATRVRPSNWNAAHTITTIACTGLAIDDATPVYKFELNQGSIAAGMHLSTNGTDTGMWVFTAGDSVWFAGGAYYDQYSNWTAKAAYSEIIGGTTGRFQILVDSGLTAGNIFTPTLRLNIDSVGIQAYSSGYTQLIAHETNYGHEAVLGVGGLVGIVGTITSLPVYFMAGTGNYVWSMEVNGGLLAGADGTHTYAITTAGLITCGSLTVNGALTPKTFNQSAKPTTAQVPSGTMAIWTDTDDSKCYICYNHGGTVKTVEMT
jgi:hypothetical protein